MENVAVLTVVSEDVEVTGATEVVAEAVAGAEAGRMRRRSGCPAPSWAVWFSRYCKDVIYSLYQRMNTGLLDCCDTI